jgi:hypothetical protein
MGDAQLIIAPSACFGAPAANQHQKSHNGCGSNSRQSLYRSCHVPIVGYRLKNEYDAIAAILLSSLRGEMPIEYDGAGTEDISSTPPTMSVIRLKKKE